MPRNPHKTRCQAPGCHNWAMRSHTHCRPHRDAELGPRGGGAPAGNLNALKTGQYAHPFTRSDLRSLAATIARYPGHLPGHLESATRSILARTHDPVKALRALQVTLDELLALIAQHLFAAELRDLLHHVPPQHHSELQTTVWKQALRMGPERRLRFLRALAARLQERLPWDGAPAPAIDGRHSPDPFPSPLEPGTPPPTSPQQT